MMIVTLIFTWHNAAIFAFLFAAGIFIYLRVRSKKLDYITYEDLQHPVNLSDYETVSSSKMDVEMTKRILAESDDDEL